MNGPTLFDAMNDAVEAMERIERNTHPQFEIDAEYAVLTVGRMRQTFTTDEVWEWLEQHRMTAAHDNRAIGPIMNRLAKANRIRFTGQYQPSRRRHASPIRVWQLV
jgi:hypothetical protein